MATVPLPDGFSTEPSPPRSLDPLQDRLFHEHHIEVPVIPWPQAPRRHLRVSAQVYNTHIEYQTLAEALEALLR
jgi:isopenicillin-N epimerase